MGRSVRDYVAKSVAEYEVAPHRYLYNGEYQPEPQTFDEWKKSFHYKEGEVVYIAVHGKPVKALIYRQILSHRDSYGFRAEMYKVQFETQKGYFSKNWEHTHPGFIQRGYQVAGLAPDVP